MILIRKATIQDCEGIMKVLNSCIMEENNFSALVTPVKSLVEEEEYFRSLKERERILVALEAEIVGFTCLCLYNAIEATSHVGEVGTFILSSARREGIGTMLNENLVILARELGYEKLIAAVRKKNSIGLKFYKNCGFSPVAELKNQVKLGDKYDNVVLMERFIQV